MTPGQDTREQRMETPLLPPPSSGPAALLPQGPPIGILGSGDFSRSLALRLSSSGFRVAVGSRDPGGEAGSLFPEGVAVCSQLEAVRAADKLVFIAVHPEHYGSLVPLGPALAGKVLVDVSNAVRLSGGGLSNAERLAECFPLSPVVKGFNVVSAWTLQAAARLSGGAQQGPRQVPVCSDCPDSKALVMSLVQLLGFVPIDLGGLSASRVIEEVPLRLFPSWGAPVLTTFIIFLFFYAYIFVRNVLLPYLDRGENNFHQLPLVTVNQTLPAAALVTLAMVYLPGLLAAVLQLSRGTKYRRFPSWLDRWLCCRKELGLFSFLLALLHAVYSLCLALRRAAGVQLLSTTFQQVTSRSDQMLWRSDFFLSSGILGVGVLSLLAITSLPSVGNALSWREFTFVQSGLGYAALTLSTVHTLFFGWDFAFRPGSYPYYLPPVFLLVLILPCVVLLGRLFLALPCLSGRLDKIRRGWESHRHRISVRRESGEFTLP